MVEMRDVKERGGARMNIGSETDMIYLGVENMLN